MRRYGPENGYKTYSKLGSLKASERIHAPSSVKKGSRVTLQTVLSSVALVVSLVSASFSYLQSRTSVSQLKLTEQQLRPHVTYSPVFFRDKKGLNVDIYSLNQSPLPARIIYADTAGWIDGEFVSPNFHSIGEDILYQEKGGLSSLPTLTGKPLSRIDKGNVLVLATCVVYASNNDADLRRWELEAVHEYIPGSRFPSRPYMKERLIDTSVRDCSARAIGQAQRLERLKKEAK